MDDTTICRICLNWVNGQFVIIDSVLIEKLQTLCPDVKTTLLGDSVICPSCISLLQKFDYLRNKYNKTKETCKVCGVNVVDQYHVTSSDTLQMCDDLGFLVPIDSKVCDECMNTMYELNTLKVALNSTQNWSTVPCDKSAIKDEVELGPVELFQSHSNLDEINASMEINTIITDAGSSCEKNNYWNKNDEVLHGHQVLGSPCSISLKEDDIEEQSGSRINSYGDNTEKQDDELQRKIKIPEHFEDPNEFKSLRSQESISHVDEECHSFKHKDKGAEEDHSLVHIKPKKVSTFECHICKYKTKQRSHLKGHLLIHMKPEDVEMFECHICEYKTKVKSSLKRHLYLIHNKPEDIEMFGCHICEYKAKQKGHLKRHLLCHKKSKYVEMFECHVCKYRTNLKSNLETHILVVHKTVEDVEMLNCHICKYKLIPKDSLKHEDIEMFECHVCEYKTKLDSDFNKHLLIHKKSEDVEMSECHICKFKTKLKTNLKKYLPCRS